MSSLPVGFLLLILVLWVFRRKAPPIEVPREVPPREKDLIDYWLDEQRDKRPYAERWRDIERELEAAIERRRAKP